MLEKNPLLARLTEMYPSMDTLMKEYLLSIIKGNIKHIKDVSNSRQLEDVQHKETVIVVGDGFDWLNVYNYALIIGSYVGNLEESVNKAINVIVDNINSGRASLKNGIVIMIGESFRNENPIDYNRAIFKSKRLAETTRQIIVSNPNVSLILSEIKFLIGVNNENSRRFERISFDEKKLDNKNVKNLLRINEEIVREISFNSLKREEYRKRYGIKTAVQICADGRLHFSLMTGIPIGIVRSFKNIGGFFDFKWDLYERKVADWFNFSINQGMRCVVFPTYHYSEGSSERCCAGCNNNIELAKENAFNSIFQIESIYGKNNPNITVIPLGIETDNGSFIFHGVSNNILDTAKKLEIMSNSVY